MTHRLGLFLSALVLTLLGMSENIHAQGRVALVVGNGAYSNVSRLPNPTNDAADVSQSLQRLGFDVTTVTDATFDVLRRSLIDFGRAARGADMAVLFFGGHGVEIKGDNWLLPVDAELRNDLDVDTEAVSLQSAMLAVSNAKRLGLVILDACRNNPFVGKMRRVAPAPAVPDAGLAPVEPAENVLVAYAARDGTTANDGTGRNSPFTTALLRHLETPGLEIEFLFRNVREDVMTATNDEQQPFVYGSLSREEIYLKDAPPAQVAYNTPDVMSDAGEIAWSFLKGTSDIGTLRRFVDQFPASGRVPDARFRISSLESAPAPEPVPAPSYSVAAAELDTLTRQTTRPFLKNTPAVEAAWKVVKDTSDASVIRRFAAQFPSTQRQAVANQRLTELGEPPTFPRDLLLRAAADPDVIQCYRTNDMTAPECQRAIERFPDIWNFMSDFRFRFAFCRALDALGHCNAVTATAWSNPLFLPKRRFAGSDHPGQHNVRAGLRTKGSTFHRAGHGNSARHGDKSSRSAAVHRHRNAGSNMKVSSARASSKTSNAKPDSGHNGPQNPGMHSSGGHHR